jgi:hypothetical protein
LLIIPRETKGKIRKPKSRKRGIKPKREAIKAESLGHVAVAKSINNVVVNSSQTPMK